jgi:hypothetical protein
MNSLKQYMALDIPFEKFYNCANSVLDAFAIERYRGQSERTATAFRHWMRDLTNERTSSRD